MVKFRACISIAVTHVVTITLNLESNPIITIKLGSKLLDFMVFKECQQGWVSSLAWELTQFLKLQREACGMVVDRCGFSSSSRVRY